LDYGKNKIPDDGPRQISPMNPTRQEYGKDRIPEFAEHVVPSMMPPGVADEGDLYAFGNGGFNFDDIDFDNIDDLYEDGIIEDSNTVQRELAYQNMESALNSYKAREVHNLNIDTMAKLTEQIVKILAMHGVPYGEAEEEITTLMTDLYTAYILESSHVGPESNMGQVGVSFLTQMLETSTYCDNPLGQLLANNYKLRVDLMNMYSGEIRQKANRLTLELPDKFRISVANTKVGQVINDYDLDHLIPGAVRNNNINLLVGESPANDPTLGAKIRSQVLGTYFGVSSSGMPTFGRNGSMVDSFFQRLLSPETSAINRNLSDVASMITQGVAMSRHQNNGGFLPPVPQRGMNPGNPQGGQLPMVGQQQMPMNAPRPGRDFHSVVGAGGVYMEEASFDISKEGVQVHYNHMGMTPDGRVTGGAMKFGAGQQAVAGAQQMLGMQGQPMLPPQGGEQRHTRALTVDEIRERNSGFYDDEDDRANSGIVFETSEFDTQSNKFEAFDDEDDLWVGTPLDEPEKDKVSERASAEPKISVSNEKEAIEPTRGEEKGKINKNDSDIVDADFSVVE
jgi:hypothetical protein